MRSKILRVFLLSLLLTLVLLIACGTTPPSLSDEEQDQVDIYAAVIRQLYTVDHTFGEPPNFPVVYLIRATNDNVGDPDIPQNPSSLISGAIQESIVTVLDDLPTDFIWVDDRGEVPIDSSTGIVEGDGAIITLGNIHYEGDRTVKVSASIYIANLAAGGLTYIIEYVYNEWRITGDTGVRWIS